MLTDLEIYEKIESIKAVCDEYEFDTEIVKDPDTYEDAMLMIFLPSTEEGLWEGEEMPEDPHMASLFITQIPSDDEDDEPVNTMYINIYTRILLDTSDMDELEVLKLINEANSDLDMGNVYIDQISGDDLPMVKYKITIGVDLDSELPDYTIAESIVYAGAMYDSLKEALLELR